MGARFANITLYRLPTVPNLTTVSANFHKPRDGPGKIHTDHTRPGGNLRKVGPMLIMDFINLTKKLESIINIVIGCIIQKVIHHNINPIQGRSGGQPSP